MDPDVVTSRRGDAGARDETTGDASSRGARAGRDRNGPDRAAGDDGTHNRGEDPTKGDRPRNL
jgi:hypothetical protein